MHHGYFTTNFNLILANYPNFIPKFAKISLNAHLLSQSSYLINNLNE